MDRRSFYLVIHKITIAYLFIDSANYMLLYVLKPNHSIVFCVLIIMIILNCIT